MHPSLRGCYWTKALINQEITTFCAETLNILSQEDNYIVER